MATFLVVLALILFTVGLLTGQALLAGASVWLFTMFSAMAARPLQEE